MTFDMLLVLLILSAALVFFITEWLRMDVVALIVMSLLAISGLVTTKEAVAGFSNPAVVTIWAMFILSEGLTHTGIADLIGRIFLHGKDYSEMKIIALFMLTAGLLSGFMNNIAVIALMMPVVLEVSRRFGILPSRVLIPLAYGTLLGGLTTIMTTQNLLVSTALSDTGFRGFRFFDFAPLGIPALLAGTAFMSLAGRHLLPRNNPPENSQNQQKLQKSCGLQDRIFALQVPKNSILSGKTISESVLNSAAGLLIISITRNDRTEVLPHQEFVLRQGDIIVAQGQLDSFNTLKQWCELTIEKETPLIQLKTNKAPLAGILMAMVVATAAFGFLHISIAAIAGATLMVITRCLTMEQAYKSINWRSIFLIAGMFPLGIAMEKTGTAEYLAHNILELLGPFGPWFVIAGLFWITVIGTLAIPAAALVLIISPIALSTSMELGIAPQAAMMAVAIAASASFISPVSHPANLLVMGPGGYRFVDYLKLGLPLILITFGVVTILFPLFWPLN